MNNVAYSIDVSNLTVAYHASREKVIACEDVSFRTRSGEFVAIVGASGCGKTTILNTLGGFVKPTSGSVRINDRLVTRPTAACTVVFQSYALFPWMTVEQNLYFGLRMKGLSRVQANPLIEKYLTMTGLSGTGPMYPYQLSGGMQQRVALARALAIEPDSILMDEPFAAVDLQTREDLQNELARLRGTTPQTVLLVTHSVDEAVYLSDRVIVMGQRPGRIISIHDVPLESPRKRELRSSPQYLAIRDQVSDQLRSVHAK